MIIRRRFVKSVKYGMDRLREIFPDGEANQMNFCLFSTSGVHGSYWTIEEVELNQSPEVTFLIVHPRLVAMQYGNVEPKTAEDFAFLKKLRQSSKDVIMDGIG